MVGDITEREALDRIAALCDEADRHRQLGSLSTLLIDVRAIVAEVTPEPGDDHTDPPVHYSGVLDREKARWTISDTLMRIYDNGTSPNAVREAQVVLDDLEAAGCVRPATIDRDALLRLLMRAPMEHSGANYGRIADAILALIRPASTESNTTQGSSNHE